MSEETAEVLPCLWRLCVWGDSLVDSLSILQLKVWVVFFLFRVQRCLGCFMSALLKSASVIVAVVSAVRALR